MNTETPSGKLHTKTVNCYVFRRTSDGPEYLLLQKSSQSQSTIAGRWQQVAGKVDPGETRIMAAVRELKEESSLEPQRIYELGIETFFNYQRDKICMHPCFAVLVSAQAQVAISEEHQDWQWVTLEKALSLLPFFNQRATIQRLHHEIATQPDDAGLLCEIPSEVWRL